jgi:hypothetical protein
LTSSKFGWIAEVNLSGGLDSLALSDPGWACCRMPGAEATSMQDLAIRSIVGRVLTDGHPLITNDPGAHHD